MQPSKADMITHPLRARILTALMGRQLTTQQMAQLLPDIPLPSLYRHVRLLTEAGVLKVAGEVRVNGARTKVYAVQKGQARIHPADTRAATDVDQLRYFTTFLNTLAENFRTYLAQRPLDPGDDPVHSLMETLHLRPDEYRQFMAELNALLEPWRARPPAPDRRRLIFAHIALPDLPDPPLS